MNATRVAERWGRWAGRHMFGLDATAAAVLGILATITAASQGWPAAVISLAMIVPLAWRRTAPVASGVAVTASCLLYVAVVPAGSLAMVVAPITVYALAAYTDGWPGPAGLAMGWVGALLAGPRYWLDEYTTALGLIFIIMLLGLLITVTWVFGRLRRVRREQVSGLAERARLLELEREQEAELAALSERSRIAREMHDIIAHSLTVVIAQADGGRYSATPDAPVPDAAAQALTTIAATGRQALTDMRSLLSVLREDGPREFASTPGAADIEGLVADLGWSYREIGAPGTLSAGAGLTAFRVAQESLTNVLKHAGPGARAEVEVRWSPRRLELTVSDDGRGAAGLVEPSPGGQGVIGMRERAHLHGGTLAAGPHPGGGYRVRLELPCGPAPEIPVA
ncbi:sensor histidine kinase [Tomitella biformata]|uniref:sensor histidine kinase n=1 Tax=Tomitella biformata TaxID=630403 RepID=UPI0004638E72|nr:histidine kinase [Tomitella biformata]